MARKTHRLNDVKIKQMLLLFQFVRVQLIVLANDGVYLNSISFEEFEPSNKKFPYPFDT